MNDFTDNDLHDEEERCRASDHLYRDGYRALSALAGDKTHSKSDYVVDGLKFGELIDILVCVMRMGEYERSRHSVLLSEIRNVVGDELCEFHNADGQFEGIE